MTLLDLDISQVSTQSDIRFVHNWTVKFAPLRHCHVTRWRHHNEHVGDASTRQGLCFAQVWLRTKVLKWLNCLLEKCVQSLWDLDTIIINIQKLITIQTMTSSGRHFIFSISSTNTIQKPTFMTIGPCLLCVLKIAFLWRHDDVTVFLPIQLSSMLYT